MHAYGVIKDYNETDYSHGSRGPNKKAFRRVYKKRCRQRARRAMARLAMEQEQLTMDNEGEG